MLIFLDADPLSYTFFSIFNRCYPSFSVCLKMLPLSTLRCDYSLKKSHPVRPSKSVSPEVLFSISFVPCLRAAGTYLLPSISFESCFFSYKCHLTLPCRSSATPRTRSEWPCSTAGSWPDPSFQTAPTPASNQTFPSTTPASRPGKRSASDVSLCFLPRFGQLNRSTLIFSFYYLIRTSNYLWNIGLNMTLESPVLQLRTRGQN